ncbi:MAG: glycerophosphoryl diester phosphodiesterase membrane domain-containing protein [Candidatus Burarchaeum sp.]|nr:glycerophosphoryl diester phosphodiesterase membrane domain-containing protein [Candidatus Burarchaeum sp.]MDO8339245.1 glycerophosphoryl diester phosphodiesterase membrane domain-containing protein [Candidatus Burarchaeum sp.]
MDLGEIWRFSYAWLRDRKDQQLYFQIFLVFLLIAVLRAMIEPGLQAMVQVLTIGMVFWVLQLYFVTKITLRALEHKNKQVVKWNFAAYFGFLKLFILEIIYSVTGIKSQVMLAIFILTILLLPSMSAFFLLLLGTYLFAVAWMSIRLSLAGPVYLEGKKDCTEAIDESWEMTKERFWSIFLASLFVGGAWSIAYFSLMAGLNMFLVPMLRGDEFLLKGSLAVLNSAIGLIYAFAVAFTHVGIYAAIEKEAVEAKKRKTTVSESKKKKK